MNRENERLKNKILDLAIRGKLVPQDINDEPASVLLEKIKQERKKLIAEKKIKQENYSEIYKNPTDNHYYEKFENGTIKDITEEIPFEIPNNWAWCRIGNIEEINLGFTYKPDYTDNGVYFLSVKDISNGKIDFSKAQKVSEETYKNASYGSKPRKGDILFGRVGTMGKPQIVETEIPFCIFVSLGFFRDHLNIFDKKYIALWMESKLFDMQVQKNVKGAAQKNLNTGWLKDFFIPIPPLNEQSKISKKFEYYTNILLKKDVNDQKLIKCKHALKSKILDKAIRGKLVKQDSNDESAEILINKILDEKRALMKSKEIKKENLSIIYKDSDNQFYEKFDDGTIVNITDEIPFNIPNTWRWARLSTICTKIVDGDHNPPQGQNVKTEYIMLSAKNIQNNKLVNFSDARFLLKENYEKGKQRISLKDGDILLTIVGTLGRSCIYKNTNKNILFQRSVSVISTLINNQYLKNVFDSSYIQNKMQKESTGTAQRGFYLNQLSNILIPVPSLREEIKIVSKLEEILKTAE